MASAASWNMRSSVPRCCSARSWMCFSNAGRRARDSGYKATSPIAVLGLRTDGVPESLEQIRHVLFRHAVFLVVIDGLHKPEAQLQGVPDPKLRLLGLRHGEYCVGPQRLPHVGRNKRLA